MNYVVEPLFLTKRSEDRTPDIVGSGQSGWFVIEITMQPGSKAPNLRSYQSIDSRYLGLHGLPSHDLEPDLFSSRLSHVDDGPHCQLIVRDQLEVIKENYVHNQLLKKALVESRGADLRRIPNIPITLLPEMRPMEIRRGLIDIVIQLFRPESKGKSLVQIVDEGLERLSNTISVPARSRLKDSVKREMDTLVKGCMDGYIFFDEAEGVYKSTEKFRLHPKTMERIALALRDWAGIGPQKTLEDFD